MSDTNEEKERQLRNQDTGRTDIDEHGHGPGIGSQSPLHFNMITSEIINDVYNIIEKIKISGKKDKPCQIIGFTSAEPEEGTSTLVALTSFINSSWQETFNYNNRKDEEGADNMPGTEIAIPRRGTLLIDAQFRNPSLHTYFGQTNENSLCDILSDELFYNDAIKKIFFTDLKLITNGHTPGTPLPQINLSKFHEILDMLKSQFDFIFVDIPPPLHYAEGLILSKICDGIVMVVRAGKTRWEVVNEATNLLEEAGVNILGGILNRRKFYIPNILYRRL